jgi:hypothetical protein
MMLFELSKKQFKTRRQQSAANPLPLLQDNPHHKTYRKQQRIPALTFHDHGE